MLVTRFSGEVAMKRFVEGVDRGQSTLFPECLDDWIDEDNPVRVIDVFVDELDLSALDFGGVDPKGLQPPRACARAMTILLGPPPVHRGAFIGSRPAWARPSGQKVCRQATRGHLPASSPFQSVTPSQARDSAAFKHFGNVTPCSVVTNEKVKNPRVSAGCDAVTY